MYDRTLDAEDFRKLLGRKIYMLRKRRGMTQIDLSKLLGYESTGMMSRIENGDRGMDLEKIYKAANILDVNVTFLLSNKPMSDEDLDMFINLSDIINDPESESYKRAKVFLKKEALRVNAPTTRTAGTRK